jgi:uncharacterized protein YgbK (DUF1537 family)
MPQEEAVQNIARILQEVMLAAEEAKERVTFVLRGDFTLRGHVFAEIDAFTSNDSDGLLYLRFLKADV